ncbi:MAG: prepilin-type N-terminal cleavage/methylation domain-containing protein [Candidatus Marinimicrobia bacterium]|nr:prepilin-type N-terminal cleavage/methylation domain-containing protein [Candidatus Neomarinimicrobiota bacterium]
MKMKRRLVRRAFTLVELLVVIAIIGILIGLLMPALSGVMATSRLNECQSNLRELARMTVAWSDDHNERLLPFGNTTNNWDWTLAREAAGYTKTPDTYVGDDPPGVFYCGESDVLVSLARLCGFGMNDYVKTNATPSYRRLSDIRAHSSVVIFGDSKLTALGPASFDPRHRGKVNFAYFDGHAETLKSNEVRTVVSTFPWRDPN